MGKNKGNHNNLLAIRQRCLIPEGYSQKLCWWQACMAKLEREHPLLLMKDWVMFCCNYNIQISRCLLLHFAKSTIDGSIVTAKSPTIATTITTTKTATTITTETNLT
jgi:hypothetical protein